MFAVLNKRSTTKLSEMMNIPNWSKNSLDKITERLYPSHRKGTFGRKNERFENGCVPFQETKGGMDVMNVVVRETGPPCASKLPVKIKHIEILRRIIYYGS